ncbi:MAG: FHA domain-containing protein [Planctomycetota bacterium]|nr:FHA domain-containing protein [Planctomycetota bacterium]
MPSTVTHQVFLQLTPAHAGESTNQIRIEEFPVRLGRGGNVDYMVEDRWLSRHHCEIDCHQGVVIVRDLTSRHGTFINENRIQESVLNEGDTLRIGLTRFVVDFLKW